MQFLLLVDRNMMGIRTNLVGFIRLTKGRNLYPLLVRISAKLFEYNIVRI